MARLTAHHERTQKTPDTVTYVTLASEALRVATDRDAAIDYAVRMMCEMGFDRVRLYLYDETKNVLRGARCSYLSDARFARVTIPLTAHKTFTHTGETRFTKTPLRSDNNPTLVHELGDTRVRETLVIPLVIGRDALIGHISVDNALTHRPLGFERLRPTLTPFVGQLTLVLDRFLTMEKLEYEKKELTQKFTRATDELTQKNAELTRLAIEDELTGLPNRRDFSAQLETAFHAASARRPLTLAMLDLDFLKRVNDTAGHLAGDRIIAQIGEILRSEKELDYAARYAGDEFVIFLRGTRHPTDCRILERVRRTIQRRTKCSVSIGIATYPAATIATPLDLIRTADDALYHAKHTGRGRIVCADSGATKILSADERRTKIQKLEKGGTIIADYIAQLEVLNAIADKLQRAKSEASIYRIAWQVFQTYVGFARVRVYRIDREAGQMTCLYATGVKDATLPLLSRALTDRTSLSVTAIEKGIVIDTRATRYHRLMNPMLTKIFGTRATVAIPLIGAMDAVGVVVGDYDPDVDHFDETNYRLFLAIGNHVALALQRAQLFDRLMTLNAHLEERIRDATTKLRAYSHSLEAQIADNKRLRESERQAHFDIISALVVSLESKDSYTRGHSARVARYAYRLGRAVNLPADQLVDLRYGALLHDIGKLTVDYDVLNKRTSLTDDELMQLAQHPITGGRIVSSVQFLRRAADFVRHHHERWDGHGYPDKLAGEAIPLPARIINIADSYDAMTTRRSYGRRMTKKEAMHEFELGAGRQFDPTLVRAFVKLIEKGRL